MDDDTETRSGSDGGRRDRSPNYPALTFNEALDCAKKIWDQDKRHPVTKDVAAQHMGYSKASGATIPLVASMKRYGLLASVGKDLQITEDAHFIFVHPEDSPERSDMIKKLAMSPSIFVDVLKAFPGGLPSDATLSAKLQTAFKFASATAADACIRSLREAVRISSSAGPAEQTRKAENIGELINPAPKPQPVPVALNVVQTPVIQNQPRQNAEQARPWDLGNGAVVTVLLPSIQLTRKNIERLKKYVAALEMEASIAWDSDDESGDD